jgi:hypothetical protein
MPEPILPSENFVMQSADLYDRTLDTFPTHLCQDHREERPIVYKIWAPKTVENGTGLLWCEWHHAVCGTVKIRDTTKEAYKKGDHPLPSVFLGFLLSRSPSGLLLHLYF